MGKLKYNNKEIINVIGINRMNKRMMSAFIIFAALYFIMTSALHVVFSYIIDSPFTQEEVERAQSLSNLVLLSSYAAIAVGMLVWAMIPRRFFSENKRNYCYKVSAGFVILFLAVAFFMKGIPASICTVGAVLSSASALSLLLLRLPELIPLKRVGIFIGGGYALTGLVQLLMFSSPFWDVRLPFGVFAAFLCILAVLAIVIRLPAENTTKVTENTKKRLAIQLTPTIIIVFIVILFLCTMISDIMGEHLFYFYEVFYEFPNFGYLLFAITLLMDVFSGFLFDKGIGVYGFLAGFLLMGISQAMALFFGETPLMGVPYYFFNYLGASILMVFLFATPVYYTAHGNNRGIFPQLGFVCRNVCALIVAIGFQFIMPQQRAMSEKFDSALGTVLLLTFLGIALSTVLMNILEKQSRVMAQAIKASDDKSEVREKLKKAAITPLSPREYEVAELTVLGVKRQIIADTLNIQSSTVDSHRNSVYSKFGVRNREELLQRIEKLNS